MFFRATISAVAGTKMAGTYAWVLAPFARRIRKIMVTGGSAALDTEVIVKAGSVLKANLYNLTTDDVVSKQAMYECGLYVPANVPIQAQIGVTAAGSGSVYLHLDIVPTKTAIHGDQVISKSVTAATAVVGYDFADGEDWKSSTVNRIIRSHGLSGSAATGDTIIEASVGNQFFSEIYNVETGQPPSMNVGMMEQTQFNARGKELEYKVVDAAATNPACLVIVFGGTPLVRRTFRRFNRGRRY